MKWKPALTIIELMVTIALIAAITVPSVLAFRNIRLKQSLSASSESLIAVLKRAHIYARESKEHKSWGVKYKDSTGYTLVSGDFHSFLPVSEFVLENPTTFLTPNFEIWFDQGTGETVLDTSVVLTTPTGVTAEVTVTKNGVVEAR